MDIFLSINLAGTDEGEGPEEEGVGGRDFVNTRGLRLSLLVARLSLRTGVGGGIRALASDETLRRLGAGAVSDKRPIGASDERPDPTSNETRLPASKANGPRPEVPAWPEATTCPCPCPCAEAEATVICSDPPRTKLTRSEVKGTPFGADASTPFEAGAGTDARSEGSENTGPTAKGTLTPLKSRLVYTAGGDG